jgi:hypothetical protein
VSFRFDRLDRLIKPGFDRGMFFGNAKVGKVSINTKVHEPSITVLVSKIEEPQ